LSKRSILTTTLKALALTGSLPLFSLSLLKAAETVSKRVPLPQQTRPLQSRPFRTYLPNLPAKRLRNPEITQEHSDHEHL
jgi:hypothetical protein